MANSSRLTDDSDGFFVSMCFCAEPQIASIIDRNDWEGSYLNASWGSYGYVILNSSTSERAAVGVDSPLPHCPPSSAYNYNYTPTVPFEILLEFGRATFPIFFGNPQ